MQVKFEQVSDKEQEQALIKAVKKTEDIQSAIDLLEGGAGNIAVIEDGKICFCKRSAIYYIESVDKRVFIYTKDNCYETKLRLYELENTLGGYFARCSKSLIVNLRKVRNVSSELGGRMNATLLNGEQLVISRSFVKEIRRRLEI